MTSLPKNDIKLFAYNDGLNKVKFLSMKKIIPVLLCGGIGKRLWPVSNENVPKQFLKLFSNNSFLQKTVLRVQNKEIFDDPILISNISYLYLLKKQLKEINVKPKKIILEPEGKNTAPSTTLVAIILSKLKEYQDSKILFLPTDHHIENKDIKKLEQELMLVEKALLNDYMILFGIKPLKVETNYGYIKKDKVIFKNSNIYNVSKFIEKPSLEKASKYQKNNNFLWNSGILFTKCSTFLREVKAYAPDIFKHCSEAINNKVIKEGIEYIDSKAFKKCENISLDYCILEKSKKLLCITSDISCSDLGSWCLLREFKKFNYEMLLKIVDYMDKYYNVNNSLLLKIDNFFNSFFQSEMNSIFEINNLNTVFNDFSSKLENRLWGSYLILYEKKYYKIKILSIDPNKNISLQKHLYRSEYWKILSSSALIDIEDKQLILHKGETIYVPKNKQHRIKNITTEKLFVLEFQVGNYISEKDIIHI